jgi:hypothetical protein
MVMTSTANLRKMRSELIADQMSIETQRMINEDLIPALIFPKVWGQPK